MNEAMQKRALWYPPGMLIDQPPCCGFRRPASVINL